MSNPIETLEYLNSHVPNYISQLRAIDCRTAHYNDLLSPSDIRRREPSRRPVQAHYPSVDTLAPRPSSLASDSSPGPSSVLRTAGTSPYKRKRGVTDDDEGSARAPLRLKYRARSKLQVDFDGDAQSTLASLVDSIAQARSLVWKARSNLRCATKNQSVPSLKLSGDITGVQEEKSQSLKESLEIADRLLEENSRLCEVASFQMLRLGQFHEESGQLQDNFKTILEACQQHLHRRDSRISEYQNEEDRIAFDKSLRYLSGVIDYSPRREPPPKQTVANPVPLSVASNPPSLTHSLPSSSNPSNAQHTGIDEVPIGALLAIQPPTSNPLAKACQTQQLPAVVVKDNQHEEDEADPGDEDDDEEEDDFELSLPPIRLTSKLR